MMWLLWVLVTVIALQRVGELALNRRNQRRLLERGGRLVADDGYRGIVAVHAAWFLAIVAEATTAPWAGAWFGTWPLLGVYGGAEALRLWTMRTLGERWTTRVIVLPGTEPVASGPFRWMDHPIYRAVSVELVALPLAFGLPATAVAIGLANLFALGSRIRTEEAALARASPDGPTSGGA